MIRLAAFLGFCILAALISSWLSAQQGETVINWLGWQVEVMTSLLVTGLFLCFGGLILSFKLLVSVLRWPSWLGHNWRARRRRRLARCFGRRAREALDGARQRRAQLERRISRLLVS